MQLVSQPRQLSLALAANLALAQHHPVFQILSLQVPKNQDGNGQNANSRLQNSSQQTNGGHHGCYIIHTVYGKMSKRFKFWKQTQQGEAGWGKVGTKENTVSLQSPWNAFNVSFKAMSVVKINCECMTFLSNLLSYHTRWFTPPFYLLCRSAVRYKTL